MRVLLQGWRERARNWALRRQGPDALPLRLAPRRIYILPTAAGLNYALIVAAMFVAGIPEPQGTYKCDLFGEGPRTDRISAKRWQYLNAFLMQVVQLGALESSGQIPRQFRRFLLGTEVVRAEEELPPTTDLLLRYRSEWVRLAEEGEKRSWSWIKLLRPSDAANHGGLSHAAN